jgi:hypothetical protein
MNKTYLLFIDESGNYDPANRQSKVYILCGCSIPEKRREEVKILADQIKFKYWGKTDIVFHSRDLGRNAGDFEIFKQNPNLKRDFLKDLCYFLKAIPVTILLILVNKELARKRGWNKIKVVKETNHWLIYHFIALLFSQTNTKGKIVVESATAEKDKYLLDAFAYFLSPGFTEFKVDFCQVRKVLTSLSFVTKNNLDIEEQIADLFAYGARCKFEQEQLKKVFKDGCYEAMIINILKKKLFQIPLKAKDRKMKFYKKIRAFCTLPE